MYNININTVVPIFPILFNLLFTPVFKPINIHVIKKLLQMLLS